MLSNRLRRITVTVAVLGLLAPVASCAGSSTGPGSIAPPTPTQPSKSSASLTSDAPVPTWESNFSSADLEAYRRALARWEAYETSSEPIWSAGQATPEARKLFAEYFTPVVAESAYRQLKTYEQVDVQIGGTPEVFWSMAARISPAGDSVVVRQCVDFTTTKVLQYGERTSPEARFDQPLLRDIELGRLPGQDWLIFVLNEPTEDKVRSCDPDAV